MMRFLASAAAAALYLLGAVMPAAAQYTVVTDCTSAAAIYAAGQVGRVAVVDTSGRICFVTGGSGATSEQVQGNVASGATDSGNPVKVGGIFQTTPPTLTNGQRGNLQLDASANLKVTQAGQYPSGATPLTSSQAGTTGATTATLAGAASRTTYLCGFSFGGTNATAANGATAVTVTGTISGTLNFGYATLAAAATVPNTPQLTQTFNPCVPASAANTSIVVNGPALGAGATYAAVSAWGYQL